MLYVVVQFGSLLAVPILLAVFPPRYSLAGRMWGTVILYAVAKVVELLDREMASVVATGGHPWKHMAAAGAVFVYVQAVARRRPLEAAPVTPERLRFSTGLLRQGASQ